MSKQTINNGDTGLSARTAINDNFTELYDYTPQYRVFELGTQQWREGVRGTSFVRDKTLTVTGFSGTEGVDWENVFEEN